MRVRSLRRRAIRVLRCITHTLNVCLDRSSLTPNQAQIRRLDHSRLYEGAILMVLRSVTLSILKAEWPDHTARLLEYLNGFHNDRVGDLRERRGRSVDSEPAQLFVEIQILRDLWRPPKRDVQRRSDRDQSRADLLRMMIELFSEALSVDDLEELAHELRTVLTETQWLTHIYPLFDEDRARDPSHDDQDEYAEVIDRWRRTTQRLSETLGTLYEDLLSVEVTRAQSTLVSLRGSTTRPAPVVSMAELSALADRPIDEQAAALSRWTGLSSSALRRRLTHCTSSSLSSRLSKSVRETLTPFVDVIEGRFKEDPFISRVGEFVVTESQKRKTRGSHYTPSTLIELAVIGALSEMPPPFEKPVEEIRSLEERLTQYRICDPAVGGGALLMGIAQALSQRLLNVRGALGELVTLEALASDRRLIVERCLFGVDIDRVAIQLARDLLCLWVYLPHSISSDFGSPITLNLFWGESLSGHTHPLTSTGKARVEQSENQKEPPVIHWSTSFPEVFSRDQEGFDLILVNPPYISAYGRYAQSIPAEMMIKSELKHVDRLLEGLQTLSGRVNTFLLFLLKAIELAPLGRVVLIVPDTLVHNESYSPIRRALTQVHRVAEVLYLTGSFFRDATVGTALITLDRPDARRQIRLVEMEGPSKEVEVLVDAAHLLGREGCPWVASALSAIRVAPSSRSVDEWAPLSEFAEVRDGINPGARVTRERLLTDVEDGDPSLRLCVEGRWIYPFHIQRGSLWIRYDRAGVTRAEKKSGTSLRQQWIFDRPKLVYRQTASRLIVAIDLEGLCVRNSAHCILLKVHDEVVLFALSALLNSTPFISRYQHLSGEKRRVFPQVHISTVKRLNVPRCLFDSLDELTISLADEARSLYIIEKDQTRPSGHIVLDERREHKRASLERIDELVLTWMSS